MKKSTLLKGKVMLAVAITVLVNLEAISQPTVAAPTPTAAAANVISMYSNAYTNVPVDTWLTTWSAGMTSTLQVAGNDTRVYTNLDFVGIETTGANKLNITNMTKFHIDVYTPNMTAFRVKLVDFGANGIYQGTPNDDKEHELSFTPVQNAWNSYDILISDFTGLTTKANIAQLILSGNPTAQGTLYIDNVYYSKPGTPTAIVDENFENSISLFPNPSNGVFCVKLDNLSAANLNVQVLNALGQAVNTTNSNSNDYVNIDMSGLSNGIYFVQVISDDKVVIKKILIQK